MKLNSDDVPVINPMPWCSIPYLGDISSKIKKLLAREGLKVAFTSRPTLNQILSNGKDKTELGECSGVYRLECGRCSASYVGRTRRKLKIRCKEHLRRKDSQFFEHVVKEGHKDGPHKVALLHREEKFNRLCKLEEIEIKLDLQRGRNINKQGEGLSTRVVGDPPPVYLTSSAGLSSVEIASVLI